MHVRWLLLLYLFLVHYCISSHITAVDRWKRATSFFSNLKLLFPKFCGTVSTMPPYLNICHACRLQCLGQQNAFYGILYDGQTLLLLVPAGKLAVPLTWCIIVGNRSSLVWPLTTLSVGLLDLFPTSISPKINFFVWLHTVGNFTLKMTNLLWNKTHF